MPSNKDWGDLTGEGGKYEAATQDPPRAKSSYWACKGSVHTTDAGQTVGFDRYNKAYRPCNADGKSWKGGPQDVETVGAEMQDSAIAEAYIGLLKADGCLTELLKMNGYHVRSLDRLRVVLTRINKRCKEVLTDELGGDEYNRLKSQGRIANLTGLTVNGDWKITPVRQKKEKDEAFAGIIKWMRR